MSHDVASNRSRIDGLRVTSTGSQFSSRTFLQPSTPCHQQVRKPNHEKTNLLLITLGGSFALVGATFKKEATLITKLREAGAIILGKTNLSAWGMSRSPTCPNGWSPVYGQAVGAYHENQDPQGSSSGSAIAMSMNYASAAIGGEVRFLEHHVSSD